MSNFVFSANDPAELRKAELDAARVDAILKADASQISVDDKRFLAREIIEAVRKGHVY
jgi:hypothetical protein